MRANSIPARLQPIGGTAEDQLLHANCYVHKHVDAHRLYVFADRSKRFQSLNLYRPHSHICIYNNTDCAAHLHCHAAFLPIQTDKNHHTGTSVHDKDVCAQDEDVH